jgi:multicomponent Na+:H+ antiporter subunit A
MLSAILGIFIWSLLAPIVAHRLPHVAGWVLAVVPAGLTFWFAGFMLSVSTAKFATNPR